jgi:RNA polymerase sigma-70 factor (ECF subfamily)
MMMPAARIQCAPTEARNSVFPQRRPRREDPNSAQRLEEGQLLERLLDGEERAWTEFCRRYQGLLVASVRRVLRRCGTSASPEDLADLVAEVWLALLRDDKRRLRLYDPARGSLARWLGLIAASCTIDRLRARGRALRLAELPPERLLVDDSPGPDRGLETRERRWLARGALRALKSPERQFVLSCFHDQRPPQELARELGVSINTVYSRKSKLCEKLRRIVARLGRRGASCLVR